MLSSDAEEDVHTEFSQGIILECSHLEVKEGNGEVILKWNLGYENSGD
jgi:hypothetical protein